MKHFTKINSQTSNYRILRLVDDRGEFDFYFDQFVSEMALLHKSPEGI